jgi:hypothetical protein
MNIRDYNGDAGPILSDHPGADGRRADHTGDRGGGQQCVLTLTSSQSFVSQPEIFHIYFVK